MISKNKFQNNSIYIHNLYKKNLGVVFLGAKLVYLRVKKYNYVCIFSLLRGVKNYLGLTQIIHEALPSHIPSKISKKIILKRQLN
jgi:hypothetical protein